MAEPRFQEWRNKCHLFLDGEWQSHIAKGHGPGMGRIILAILANHLPHTSSCLQDVKVLPGYFCLTAVHRSHWFSLTV